MTRLLYFVMCAAGLRTRRERAPHASQDLQPSARWVRRPAAQYLRSYAVALCLCAAAVAGCTVGPNYQRPEAGAPDEFRGEAAAAPPASLGELPWWEVFRDDTLEGLLRAALANNYDLRVAVTRIDQARAVSMQARSQFFPQLAYDIEADRGRNTFFGRPVPSAGGAVGPKTFNSFLGALDASWEVDLWGRIRRLNESAQAQLLATEEARRGVTITLVADVAQAYYELLELDRELEIARQTTDSFAKSLQLFQDRYKGGVTSRLETSRAEASLASTAASVPNLQRLILIKENQLSILLGRPPGSIPRPTTLLAQALPPEVPAGLPSALLERRPDVRQAEQLMRSANAQVGVAVANFFPQINLTGLLGGASTDLAKIASRSAGVWAVGLGITGPIFKGGLLTAQHRQAVAAWEETKLLYQRTALVAFQEVSDALASREKLKDVRVQLTRSVKAYEDTVDISRDRYTFGRANYYEVLEAQQQLFAAQNALAQTERDQFLAIVQLFKALGGGWEQEEKPRPQPALREAPGEIIKVKQEVRAGP